MHGYVRVGHIFCIGYLSEVLAKKLIATSPIHCLIHTHDGTWQHECRHLTHRCPPAHALVKLAAWGATHLYGRTVAWALPPNLLLPACLHVRAPMMQPAWRLLPGCPSAPEPATTSTTRSYKIIRFSVSWEHPCLPDWLLLILMWLVI